MLRRISLEKWNRVCMPKSNEGLGIRDLRAFNEALVAKLAWTCIVNPSLLWVRILMSKSGVIKIVNNGESAKFWIDNWIPELGHLVHHVFRSLSHYLIDGLVKEFVDSSSQWNWNVLNGLLPYHVTFKLAALSTPCAELGEDGISWGFSFSRKFSTKTTYCSIMEKLLSNKYQLGVTLIKMPLAKLVVGMMRVFFIFYVITRLLSNSEAWLSFKMLNKISSPFSCNNVAV
ncbi:conserved hypothetical protein [Ricinus communis]|uniref:Reverse transcriptase zinc-binding domain-containing protein n=1 Tax=Ricinus communis TaxID=3988 RepID=B9RSH3_RICCO|nr:conserved hypothetical protein [Ricinus communis]